MIFKRIASHIQKEFALDLRSLSLMRILIASVLILDILIRFTDLKAHYTDEGVLPLRLLFQYAWNKNFFSLHTMSSGIYFQGFLFVIQLIAAIALLAGYRTRIASVISWILLVSVHNRNPLILQGGDDLLRMILFWGMFIPWGGFYSIDSRTEKPQHHMYFSAATFGYMIQVAAVYFFSALLKTSPEWRSDSTALYYALSLDQMVMPLGTLLYPNYELLKIMTFTVFRIELWVPIIMFFPFLNQSFRNIAAITFIMLHAGIGMTLFVGLFFLIGIFSAIGLLSGPIIDKLHNRLQKLFDVSEEKKQIRTIYNPITQGILVITFIYIIIWNFDTTKVAQFDMAHDLKTPGYLFRINQNWGMFAPGVFKDDGWYIFEGETANHEMIDLNRFGRRVNYNKPEHVVSMFKNDRWRKFSENYLFVTNSFLRPYYASYMLNEWNSKYPSRKINSLKMVYMKEVSGSNYRHSQPKREVLCEFRP